MGKNENRIAVVGMSVWLPGARSLKEYWENILAARQQFRRILDCRLPLKDYLDVTRKNPDSIYGQSAAYIENFEFNWKDFKIPKPTFLVTDTAQWLALEVCFDAFKDAGLSIKPIGKEAVGVIIGNSLTGEISRAHKSRLWWPYIRRAAMAATNAVNIEGDVKQAFLENFEKLFKSATLEANEDSLPGLLANTIAGRVCNYLDLGGGGYTVDGACASSLLAVAHGANALVSREMDMVIAGGVDISLDISELAGFSRIGALTPDRMMAFDRNAKGFIPGEGAGAVVLKRLEDAERDRDQIYAVLNGWGISSDGEGGITAPKAGGQALAIERAYERAGYTINDVDLFEGHGTGTAVGDRREVEALYAVAGRAPNPQPRRAGISTVKSIIGHTKGAAGIASFIKAAIAANRRTLPPTAGCQNPIPTFDSGAKTLYPILEGRKLEKNRRIKVGVSAMGFGGINCHVTLESYGPELAKLSPSIGEERAMYSKEGHELFLFSSQSIEDLKGKINFAINEIEFASVAEMTDLAADLTGRVNLSDPYKAGVVGMEVKDFAANLKSLLDMIAEGVSSGKVISNKEKTCWLSYRCLAPRIGYVFPGQGSQKLNSAKFLLHRFSENKELLNCLGTERDFVRALYKRLDSADSPEMISNWEKTLSLTENAQPSICFSSILWVKHLQRLGLQPVVTAGHSLGELTAFYAAGYLSEIDLIDLASLRGQLMKAKPDSSAGMTSLSCDRSTAEKLIASTSVVAANSNSSKQTVVAGLLTDLKQVQTKAQELGIRAIPLKVSNAFHSPLMKEASERLYDEADFSRVTDGPNCRVRLGKDGSLFDGAADLRRHFAEQILTPVDFISLAHELSNECDLLIEVGPGNVLTNLISEQGSSFVCMPVEARADALDYKVLVAALFTKGAALNLACMFEGRVIRPYIPFRSKKFIINPLEDPEALVNKQGLHEEVVSRPKNTVINSVAGERNRVEVVGQSVANPPKIKLVPAASPKTKSSLEVLIDEVEKLTGYGREAINPELRLLDGLNLDSIKAGELISRAATQLQISQNVDPAEFANASLRDIAKAFDVAGAKPLIEEEHSPQVAEVPVPSVHAERPPLAAVPEMVQLPPHEDAVATIDLIYEEIINMTGYDRNSLNPELRLLDGLNLDSIKAGELLSRTLQKLSLVDEVDPTEFANASIGDIAKILDGKRRQNVPSIVQKEVKKVSDLDVEDQKNSESLSESLGHSDIKIQAVITNSIKAVGSDSGIEIDSVRNYPIGKVADIVDRLGKESGPGKRATKQKVRPDLPGGNWVHDFTLTMVPAPLPPRLYPPRQADEPENSSVVVVCESLDSLAALAVAQEIVDLGGRSKISTYYDFQNGIPEEFREYSHFVGIFPDTISQIDAEDQAKTCLKRLMSISKPPKAAEFHRRYTTVCYIQFSGGAFGQMNPVFSLDQTSTRTFAASLHKERSDLRVRSIDCAIGAEVKLWAKSIVKELFTSCAYEAVGFNECMERSVPHIICDRNKKARTIGIEETDVILITAGGKGITAECAKKFAQKYRCKILLVGSSAQSNDPADEVNRTIAEIKMNGGECEYYQCDMGRKQAVLALIATVRNKYGKISGVIHGAGVNKPARVSDLKFTNALSEMGPKLFGTIFLAEGLSIEELKFFFVFNSSTGVIGLEGNAGYAMSNEAVGYYLRTLQHKHPKTEFISVAWGAWDEVGMAYRMTGAAKFAALGTNMMPAREAVDHFMNLFEFKPSDLVVPISSRVGDSELEIGPSGFKKISGRFLEDIQVHMPEIETISRSHLSLATDPHLSDHIIDGTVILPGVFGIEAMLQACAHALGKEELLSFEMKNIKFDLPIVVGKDGVTIEVFAQRTPESLTGIPEFRAGILCSSTEFKRSHFSMAVRFAEFAEEKSERPLDLRPLDFDPKREFYPKLLFHGPRYQKIAAVYELSESEIVYSCEKETLDSSSKRSFSEDKQHPFVGGDPFFKDSILQGLQATKPDAVFVPVSIDQWQVRRNSNSAETNYAVARMSKFQDGIGTCEFTVIDKNHAITERITGFKAKKIRSRPSESGSLQSQHDPERMLPAHDLIGDEITRMMSAIPLSIALGVKTIAGLSQMKRQQRHEIESSHANQIYSQHHGKGSLAITWAKNGAPVLSDSSGQFTCVSYSHKEDYLITCLHVLPVACDIELLQDRTIEEWKGLFGAAKSLAFEQFSRKLGNQNLAGTACWSFFECLSKLGIDKQESIEIDYDKSVLKVRMRSNGHIINTFGFLVESQGRAFWVCFSESNVLNYEILLKPNDRTLNDLLSRVPKEFTKVRIEMLSLEHAGVAELYSDHLEFERGMPKSLTLKDEDGNEWALLEVSEEEGLSCGEPKGQNLESLMGAKLAEGNPDFAERLAETKIGPQNNMAELYRTLKELRNRTFDSLPALDSRRDPGGYVNLFLEIRIQNEQVLQTDIRIQMKVTKAYECGVRLEYMIVSDGAEVGRAVEYVLAVGPASRARLWNINERAVLVSAVRVQQKQGSEGTRAPRAA